MKFFVSVLISLFLSISLCNSAEIPRTCQGNDGGHQFYVSELAQDMHFVVAGKMAPTRFIHCNYFFKRNDEILSETELWCRDAQYLTYGPYMMKLSYENNGETITHKLTSVGEMDESFELDSFEVSYPVVGREKGKFLIKIKNEQFESSFRCI